MGDLIVQMPIPGEMAEVFSAIITERQRQNDMWGNHHTLSSKDWLPVLIEEVGEVAEAMFSSSNNDLREELIQVAAVAAAWAEHIDKGNCS